MSRALLLLVLLAMYPGIASADIGTLIVLAVNAAYGATAAAWTALAVGAITAVEARRKARSMARAAREAYNAALQDRHVTTLRTTPPRRTIYGRCITGGDIVAILTSDKAGYSEKGNAYTKPDGLKHVVVAFATHQCEAIHEVYINGEPIGTLDGQGYPTGGKFIDTARRSVRVVELASGGNFTFDSPIYSVVNCSEQLAGADNALGYTWSPVGYTLSNGDKTITVNGSGGTVAVHVIITSSLASVRVQKHLGTAAQTADAALMAYCPSEWTSADRLRGIAYIVLTLDLEDTQFQGGPPNITADVSGKLIYDPRSSTTVYSSNPALCVRDYLTSADGFGVPSAEVDDAAVIAAANVCDQTITLQWYDGAGALQTDAAAKRYTCNGVTTTDDAPETTLTLLADTMAGDVAYGAKWKVLAGAWVAPVMTLNDADLIGTPSIEQVAVGMDQLFNGVRATYIESGKSAAVDMQPPYQNATFVTADGAELWVDESYPYTDNVTRCRNLARIRTERARSAMVVQYPAKLKAWPLEAGDRVQVNSTEYGWTNKTFRVTDWRFSLSNAVMLTLQEDIEAMYDLADAGNAVPVATSNLPDPNVIAAPTGVTCASGSANWLIMQDGTVLNRVKVSWNVSTSAYVVDQGRVEVKWYGAAGVLQVINLAGNDTQTYLTGVRDNEPVIVQVTFINALGTRSPPTITGHTVDGYTGSGRPGGDNLVLNSSFEVDSNSDGLADGWGVFIGGAGDAGRVHNNTVWTGGNPRHGTHLQEVEITTSTNGNDSGLQNVPVLAVKPSTKYVCSAEVYASVANKVYLAVRCYDGGSATVLDAASTLLATATVWERKSIAFTTPSNAVSLEIYVRGITATGEYMRADAVMLQEGELATAYVENVAEIADAAAAAQTTADSKVVTFIQASTPTATAVGDLWFDSDDGYKLYRAGAPGTGSWTAYQFGTNALADAAITDAKVANLSADKINAGALRGISVQAGALMTAGTYLTSATSGGESTISVKDTTDFAASGSGIINDSTNDLDAFSWTGKTSTSLTGVTGVLAHSVNASVVPLANSAVIDKVVNRFRVFDTGGMVASIGSTPDATYGDAYGTFGRTDTGLVAMKGFSNIARAEFETGGVTKLRSYKTAAYAYNSGSGFGVAGVASSGAGGAFYGNATSGHVYLEPLAGRPSYRLAGHVAIINTTGGSTDARTGTPRLFITDGTDWRHVSDNTVFSG